MSAFGDWLFTCDRAATAESYSQTTAGGAETCGSGGCRNFLLVRDQVFPPAFVDLLRSLGVDPHKDGEVYHNAQLAPGRHDYAGWFHFVGSLDRTGDFPVVELGEGFTAWLRTGSAPALDALKGRPLVQLEFHSTNVPWRLAEPEPL
jgi:hypothetical protein